MKKIVSLLLSLVMIIGIICIPASGVGDAKKLTVLFTHDLHSHIDTSIQMVDNQKVEVGGFAKIKTMIDAVKSEGNNTLLVDGGDFSMGTLYQSVYAEEAIELRMMGYLGYDATTLGNHEFDYNSGNLAKMLNSAKAKGINLPQLLVSNINWDKSTSQYKQELKTALDNYGAVQNYTVIQKGDVKIALFGLLGSDAAYYAPNSGLTFDVISDSAKKTVANIKANEDVDMIVCLSHSGTDTDKKKSEDEILAKNVPEIDVIISGHTHSTIKDAIKVGDTAIVSVGEYGKNLGRLDMTQNADGRWTLDNYTVAPVDINVVPDPATLKEIEKFKAYVKTYLAKFGYDDYSQIIGYSPYDFDEVKTIEQEQRDHDLTGLITDSYVYAVKQAEGESYKPIDVALVPAGVVRSTFPKGPITVANVYEVSSLGIGNDELSGYPLVSIYLTGAELNLIAELDASMSPKMPSIQFFTTGLKYNYNPNRAIFNRATDICLQKPDGNTAKIKDKQLYRVVTGMFTAQMLENVKKQSYGILAVTPKDANGTEIKDFNQAIVYDQNKREVKEWYALSSYIQSFEKVGGVSTITQKYENAPQNKTLNNSKKIKELLRDPNKIYKTLGFCVGIVLSAIAIAIASIV
ncbi:MAG: bifunctional UDP-sugar hydrolase/5'-nucleotidase [Oscillospiraceae bacterium]